MPLNIGAFYTRESIRNEVGGGDLQSYLPHSAGNVLCGCFDPRLNMRAPFEIDLGDGPDVIRYARQFRRQGTPVPVFLKRDTYAWEFVGPFRAIDFNQDRRDLYPAQPFRRRDAVAVLYLEPEPDDDAIPLRDEPSITTQMAIEGGVALVTHFRRERNRQLSEAKRRSYRAENGALSCQACGLAESGLPEGIAEACYEVHHLIPIGDREAPVRTRLDDLAVLCANCHRLIHRTSPMISVDELATLRR